MPDMLLPLSDRDTVASVIGEAEHALRGLGVVAGAYYLTPPYKSQVGKRTVVAHFGYPDDLAAAFLEPSNFENDPIPDYVMRRGVSMTWRQALERITPTDAQHAFVEKCRSLGIVDGAAVPLFGPNGRNSYSAFNFGRPLGPADQTTIQRVVEIAQFAHRKVCALIERDYSRRVPISPREQEVLYWMARGKSNTDVATILGISGGTVDTFVRRLYAKLGVNDRVSAVLEGMGRGLFKLG